MGVVLEQFRTGVLEFILLVFLLLLLWLGRNILKRIKNSNIFQRKKKGLKEWMSTGVERGVNALR